MKALDGNNLIPENKLKLADENNFSLINHGINSTFENLSKNVDQVPEQRVSINVIQEINDIFKYLKTCPETSLVKVKIDELRNHYKTNTLLFCNHPTVNISVPIDEIIYDLFMNELLENSDIHLFLSFIDLFDTLIPIYQESIGNILIQNEFFESILAIISNQEDFGIENFRRTVIDFIFHLVLLNQAFTVQSLQYFDTLISISAIEIKENESEVSILMNILEYIPNILSYNSTFISSKNEEISNLIIYVTQRNDFHLFMKPIFSLLLQIMDFCLDSFADLIYQLDILRINISQWESTKDTSLQIIFLQIIHKFAERQIISDSKDSDLSQICEFVFSFYHKPNDEMKKLSWMTTFSLIQSYSFCVSLFLSLGIVDQIIEICQSDASYENKKATINVLFYLLVNNNEILNDDNYENLNEIFNDYHDLKLINDDIILLLDGIFENHGKT